MAEEGMPGRGLANGEDRVQANARVALVARLRSCQGNIEQAIFARVQGDRFDRTGADDPEYVMGLRAAGRAALEYTLTGVESWGRSLAPVPEDALEQARRAARTGVGLETVLRRYLAGHAVVEDFVVWEFERGNAAIEAAVLRAVLQLIAILVDRLICAVSSTYGREAEQVARKRVESVNGRARGRRRGPAHAEITGLRARSSERAPATEERRERVLTAMMEVVAERGFVHTTVRLVSARAGISASTFYAEFASLKECFIAVLDFGVEQAYELIVSTFAREASWRDRVRSTLIALMVFFDSAPQLTRVWFVESLAAGSWALEHRERSLVRVRSVVLENLPPSPLGESEPTIVAGVISSILGLIHTHLVTQQKPGPLIDLLGPLMGLVTAPYLSLSDVEAEVKLANRLVRAMKATDESSRALHARREDQRRSFGAGTAAATRSSAGRSVGARRARECLDYIADHPGASNNEIAAAIGIVHRSQISKLLSTLHGEGLIARPPVDRTGAPNAWRLTTSGVAHSSSQGR